MSLGGLYEHFFLKIYKKRLVHRASRRHILNIKKNN